MTPLDALAACAILVGVVALSMRRRRELGGTTLSLFRVLLPSWRFFESVQEPPRLMCRFADANAELGAWHELLPPVARPWHALILDAPGNLRLACLGVLEQLCSDLETLPPDGDPAQLVSYQLVCNIVDTQLASNPGAVHCVRFQFCLAEPEPDAPRAAGGQLLMSEIHARDPVGALKHADRVR